MAVHCEMGHDGKKALTSSEFLKKHFAEHFCPHPQVEIGKRDLLGAGKLDMAPFLANRNYCCVDLDQMSRERPHIVGE